ncbi:X-ray repair cross-complementing protein 5-like [Danaus plexippus]|uniref:X-ray repair cross-complementing protein 5-like n=1 Tax=Danaus plexippus TaxID=13037 RepID=UPI002AB276BD|nr:X-ray repair cross-complementing protein 5-like [Danaus plexippus]
MAPTKVDQGTIIILDVGKNVSILEDKNQKSFFESARECAVRIIERKILSQGKNLLGIILLGSKISKNNLSEQTPGCCRNIELLAELQYPTWKMIRDLPTQPTKSTGNWLDALIVAVDHFKSHTPSFKIADKNIILLTNFEALSDLEESDIETAISGFQEDGFELDVIGPELYNEDNKNSDIDLARKFVEGTNGSTATFDYAMRYLLFHKKKTVNSNPWNVDLSIGPNIKIPVSAYIRIKDEPVVKNFNKSVRNPVTEKSSATEYIERKKTFINTEAQMEVESTEVIKGYQYGEQVIPFSDFDKSMIYDAGNKSLNVYGFTKSGNVTWQNLNGDGLYYVFGQKGDKKSEYAVRCLVECLLELDLVAIVRRVYNNGNAPRMFVLMPVIDSENFVGLSMAGLCYKEEIKSMAFPATNLKKYNCSEQQVEAFKELIKAMDLTKAYDESDFDDTEAFPIAKVVSPWAQYILDCIAFRAMNPHQPLPQPRDDIMVLFKVPPLIEKRARDPMEKLKELFELNRVEVKKPKRKTVPMDIDEKPGTSRESEISDDMPKVNLNVVKRPDIIIGTLNPINDYEKLKNEGRTICDLYKQMIEAIESLIHGNIDGDFTKALDAMAYLRSESCKTDPSYYNNWIKNFKLDLIDRKQNKVLHLISEENLSYILKSENNLSNFASNVSDESQMYENDTVPTLTQVNISSEVDNMFDNMFDDM